MKASINLPNIVRVNDYHDFRDVQDTLRSLGVKGIKVRELGCTGYYIGAVYTGNWEKAKKTPIVVKALAKIKKFDEEKWTRYVAAGGRQIENTFSRPTESSMPEDR